MPPAMWSLASGILSQAVKSGCSAVELDASTKGCKLADETTGGLPAGKPDSCSEDTKALPTTTKCLADTSACRQPSVHEVASVGIPVNTEACSNIDCLSCCWICIKDTGASAAVGCKGYRLYMVGCEMIAVSVPLGHEAAFPSLMTARQAQACASCLRVAI